MRRVTWYKYGDFWRRGDGDDDHSPQDREDGVVDFIFNHETKSRKEGDMHPGAVRAHLDCGDLLIEGKRFPDEFRSKHEVKAWWMYYIRRSLRKIRNQSKLKPMYRSQKDMTRDPYRAYRAMYAWLCRFYEPGSLYRRLLDYQYRLIKIPFGIRRFSFMRNWRILKTDNRKHFVKRLEYLDCIAFMDWYEENYEDDFYENKELNN